MPCPIVIQRNITSTVVLADLDNLTLTNSNAADISFIPLQVLANSASLQNAITAGEVTLTYLGSPVSNLSELCFSSANIITPSWAWQAGIDGSVSVAEIALSRTNVPGNSSAIYFVNQATSRLDKLICSSGSTADWTIEVQSATSGNASTWTTNFTGLVNYTDKELLAKYCISRKSCSAIYLQTSCQQYYSIARGKCHGN